MDREQARFVLNSFRPDGSDGADPEFAAALKLAHEDPELGDWLAGERSFDAAFAAALAEVRLPADLGKNIILGLTSKITDFPHPADEVDSAMIGALASIQPPPSRRATALLAMRLTAAPPAAPRRFPWWSFALPLAVTAGIAVALVVTHSVPPEAEAVASIALPLEVVETGFIHAFESPMFQLDEHRGDHGMLISHLQSRKLPCPGCLPPGLANVKGVGCRELVICGKSGSLICFDERDNGTVHLVIFERKDVTGDLPDRKCPDFCQHGRWTVARWADEERVFMLLGSGTDQARLAALF